MKIRRPEDVSPSEGIRPPAYDKARERAIERRKSAYIALMCGHFTTWEEDELYSCWRPAKNRYWCDKCNQWLLLLSKKKRAVVGDVPLF